jgi:hypothetical protein
MHAAAAGARQPGQHADEGGFAGAVGTEQAEKFALLDGQIDAIDHGAGAVALDGCGKSHGGLRDGMGDGGNGGKIRHAWVGHSTGLQAAKAQECCASPEDATVISPSAKSSP